MPRMRPGDQPPPVPNDQPDMWLQVIEDMHARRQLGLDRYGSVLQPLNGRNTMLDAYEEALDHLVYLRTEMAERALLNAAVARLSVQLAAAEAPASGSVIVSTADLRAVLETWASDGAPGAAEAFARLAEAAGMS